MILLVIGFVRYLLQRLMEFHDWLYCIKEIEESSDSEYTPELERKNRALVRRRNMKVLKKKRERERMLKTQPQFSDSDDCL